MSHGLPEASVARIQGVLARFGEIEKALLYGSALSSELLGSIANGLDDLLLPYTIDLSIFEQLGNPDLREHIERVGVVFYERQI